MCTAVVLPPLMVHMNGPCDTLAMQGLVAAAMGLSFEHHLQEHGPLPLPLVGALRLCMAVEEEQPCCRCMHNLDVQPLLSIHA